jgi:hypothetical protein
MKTNKLLTDEYPLIVLPSLALEFGLTEAMLLQQIHYWIGKADTIYGGKVWTYQTFNDWHAQLPFISIATIRAALGRLQKIGVVLMKKLAKWKSNRTNYYTIDYQKLEAIAQIAHENGALVPIKLANASAKNQHIDLPTSDPSICSEVAPVYTETHQRTPQRKKQKAVKRSKQPEPLIIISPTLRSTPPTAPMPSVMIGTITPTIPAASPQQLDAMPTHQRELWQQLRLAKLDIAHDDPLIAHWISKSLVKHIIQQLLDAKARQSKPYDWHTPKQLGLCRSAHLNRRAA